MNTHNPPNPEPENSPTDQPNTLSPQLLAALELISQSSLTIPSPQPLFMEIEIEEEQEPSTPLPHQSSLQDWLDNHSPTQ